MHLADMMPLAVEVGGYVNVLKLLPMLVLLALWARLMTWADKDAIVAHLPREGMNSVQLACLVLGTLSFFFLPNYFVALGAFVFFALVGFGIYLGVRNKQVGLKDLRKSVGAAGKGKSKGKVVEGAVTILARQGPVPAPDDEDPYRPAYDAFQAVMTNPLATEAERVELRPAEGAYSAQVWTDGVAYGLPGMDLATGAALIGYVKGYAGMDVEDRRKPQKGELKVSVGATRYDLEVVTAGSTAGESMRITINPKRFLNRRLETLGFTEEQMTALREALGEREGIVLVTAPRGQGLTTQLYALARAHDAFLQHLQSIERVPREELEGITQVKLGPGAGPADEFKQVEWVVSQQPDIILLDEILSADAARLLIQFASPNDVGEPGKRVYIGMRSGSVFEALEHWNKLVGNPALAASALRLVISGRIMRRLCEACKVTYQPDPETLRKLNMDPARVQNLCQARTEPVRDQKGREVPCTFCHDLRYKGRFGIFETFTIDNQVRQLLAARAPANELKKVFRQQRNFFLQEVALAHVEAGQTSVQEVIRVLKGSDQPARRA
jgi:type IV pilus assembly protein PilB